MSAPPHGDGEGAPTGSLPRTTDDVIEALVTQFSQRTAFVRELIQNALDAGAGRIDVGIHGASEGAPPRSGPEGQAPPAGGWLHVSIADDGEGMDQHTVEHHLLVLFRSTKEDDRTRIGQFGVGFVSLFAVDPEVVVVDTARHGAHLRLVFDRERRYTLATLDEPFEGTRVRMWIPTAGPPAELAREIHDAVHYWCRHAPAEIVIDGEGDGWSWSYEQVRHPFAVDSPYQRTVHGADGFRAAVGLCADGDPLAAYYSHGLTLLETREPTIPGVTFRVESGALQHTLTRDNVRRDQGYASVIARLREMARRELVPGFHAELAMTALADPDSDDGRRHDALLALTRVPIAAIPADLRCLRTPDGTVLAPADCRTVRRLLGISLRRGPAVIHWAPRGCPLAAAMSAAGLPVLLGPPERHPDAHVAASCFDADIAAAADHFVAPSLARPGSVDYPDDVAALVATADALSRAERGPPVIGAVFADRGRWLKGRLALRQLHPGRPERVTAEIGKCGAYVVDVHNPLLEALMDLDPRVSGPLLLWSVKRACGDARPISADLEIPLLTTAHVAHNEGTG